MRSTGNQSVGAAAIYTLLLSSCVSAEAGVRYTYTGNPFTTFVTNGPTTPPQSYTTTDFVRGSFVLPSALAGNLAKIFISPVSFSFSDGVQTITDQSVYPLSRDFEFSTDANGNIIAWTINLGSITPSIDGQILTSTSLFPDPPPSGPIDLGEKVLCGPGSSSLGCVFGGDPFYQINGIVAGSPGTWSVSDGVPESSTWAMMLLGIGGLSFAGYMRAELRGTVASALRNLPFAEKPI